MEYEIIVTDEFEEWWDGLDANEQESIDRIVGLLSAFGPVLRQPHSSGIKSSRYPHMRELRIQHRGRPYRVLYAFDPKRRAVLLIGGDKTGDARWYEVFVPLADALYEIYLGEMESEQEDG